MMGRKEMRAEVVQTKQIRTGTDLQVGVIIYQKLCWVMEPSCDPLCVLQGVLDTNVPVQGDQAELGSFHYSIIW